MARSNPLIDSDLSRANLRFALVHDWLTIPGGSEDVFREICALYPGVAFTSQWDPDRVRFLRDYEVRTSFVQKLPLALTKHYIYAPVLPNVYRNFSTDEFDVILSDSHSFAHGVPKKPGALHICYYHTPARSLWVPEVDPRASTGKLAFLKKMVARRLRRLDLVASRNPDVIFANSHTTAERVRRIYGREVKQVIYPPVHVNRWLDVPRRSESKGLLYWGRLISYKRVDLAIEAAKRTGDRLQIVGEGPLEHHLKQMAEGYPQIEFHGRLPDEDLKALMSECRAFVFPAYEDFGIVAVEALAAGLPVVAFKAGGSTETVLPEFGQLFESQTVDAVVDAIQSLEGRRFDVEAMRQHARKFSADRFRTEYKAAIDAEIERHFSWSAT